jgi:shikimate kinase
MHKSAIFISGSMGSGKSTVGNLLAKKLNVAFKDLDLIIEAKAGVSLQHFFNSYGEDQFRDLEKECLQNLITNTKSKTIISLGGGTVAFHENLNLLLASGILIYLDCSPAVLAARITKETNTRPLLDSNNQSKTETMLKKLLEKRKPFYDKAHIRVNGELEPTKVCENIVLALTAFNG